MKTIPILILSLLVSSLYGQDIVEKEVKSTVNSVTVFLEGAQITRKQLVQIPKGTSVVKFVNLSPFIDARSVQVKAEGDLTVLSVNHQQNYLEKPGKSKELTGLDKSLEIIEDKLKKENTYLAIIKEELAFLHENRNIGGKNEQVNILNLQQASDFYSKRLTALKMQEIERDKTLSDLNKQKADLQNQINTLSDTREFPTGEILVKVNAAQANSFPVEISYMVANAGWFPSYDIRAKNINEPIQLIYKANVKQDTKVDWKDVKLKFSSATPNVSGVAPQLIPYFLNYNTLPPSYKASPNSVSGKVFDSTGEPLPGASVKVEGTTIGAITDMEGNYSITIPNNSNQLTYSFVGCDSQTLPISGAVMNVALKESEMALDEVVVVGYGSKSKLQGSVAGISKEKSQIKIRGISSLAIPTVQVKNQTTVDFEINTPYSIKSDNKNYLVDMSFYEVPAFYQYYSVPKIDRDAFLIANMMDWEKYNLLEGEANIFFEDTYVGKTLLDVRYASDTLELSLGRDKQVTVKREKVKDYTTKQFLGNKKEDTRTWKTTVKNNKNQEIHMILLDQVPVPTIQEIEVGVQNASGAVQNNETGEIKWAFKLAPNATKEFDLKYSVKYPKNKNLIVE